jgi:hypothetical protein
MVEPKDRYWKMWAEYPPCFVRLVAKPAGEPHQLLADAEIALASGITLARIREIKCMLSWDECTHAEMRAYTKACGFDPTETKHRRRAQAYEIVCNKRQALPFHTARAHPRWESEILPVMRLLKQRLSQSSAA